MTAAVGFLPICCCLCKHLIRSDHDGFKEYSCSKNSFRPYRSGACKLCEPLKFPVLQGQRQLSIFEVNK
jgi:hypothetical protein